MKYLQLSLLAFCMMVFVGCQNENQNTDADADMDGDADVEMTVTEETKQKSRDIGIAVGGEKDMDGDGVADVMLTSEGQLVELHADDHAEMDDGEVEIDHDKTYHLEYDEEDQKWEIDEENEFEQTYEKVGEGIKDVFDGKDDK